MTGRQRYKIIDQDGNEVGRGVRSPEVHAWVDDDGNVWVPPTAWAYWRACETIRKQKAELAALKAEPEPPEFPACFRTLGLVEGQIITEEVARKAYRDRLYESRPLNGGANPRHAELNGALATALSLLGAE
jgi:hypothetical protein